MILSVHQPQYLPWLGYFHKLARSDLFLFLDDVQYKKREFQNRNKIKTPNGPLWLTIPVITKGLYTQHIKDVRINREEDWEQDHWKSIEFNYRKAAYFNEHRDFFYGLYQKKWDSLQDISVTIIDHVLSYLGIATPRKFSSEYNAATFSTERIIELCKKTGADTYLSGAGGRAYMDETLFEKCGITVMYQDFKHPEYPQLYGGFEPYMSIVDMLFNAGPQCREIFLKD